jgi:hypothetical protein
MGSRRTPLLSDSAVCRLYRDGESRFVLCMRAGLTNYELTACLRRNGIPLRDDAEARELAAKSRARWKSTMRMRVRLRRAA